MSLAVYQTQLIPTLKKYFGYDQFRDQQQEIVETVLSGNDCLVIMPTGGGKSICFQLPALLFEGITLVISPLIALMKDQVDGMKANGVPAAYYNSSQSDGDRQEILEQIRRAELKLLYVAPESIFLLEEILNEDKISCVAIDEAHCISSWGHDFRPSYQKLSFLKKTLPNTPIIALTATADKATRHDITQQLLMPEAKQFISSFDRKNIHLEVRSATDRVSQITRFINKRNTQSGIVYCLSRKSTEQMADKLKGKGILASAYHAGLGFEERSQVQEDFINDKIQVVCATIAFGMGIDKSNVRWVIHYNLPKNIEGYYQEIGRSGRDGLNAHALLFYSYFDVVQLRKFTEGTPNESVQNAKLDRMMQFADATTCRRKILLSYFGELLEHNCGNCDVCKNPPQFIDGTILAQKVLSAIVRLKESEATGTVVDLLRGSQSIRIQEKQYQQLPTFGVGRDVSWKDWQHYIIQLVNLGYCEIAFHENNALKLTDFSAKVLYAKEKVMLTLPVDVKEKKATKKELKQAIKTDDSLFERLRKLRYAISREEKIPPYLVFNDATLTEIVQERPLSPSEFIEISGVGQRKLEVYGDRFMNEIQAFLDEKKSSRKKSETHLLTFELIKEGLSIEDIAKKRGLSGITIFSHIARLYSEGKPVDIYQYVSKNDVEQVRKAQKELSYVETLKPYFEYFEEKLDYHKIRLALTIIAKEGN